MQIVDNSFGYYGSGWAVGVGDGNVCGCGCGNGGGDDRGYGCGAVGAGREPGTGARFNWMTRETPMS